MTHLSRWEYTYRLRNADTALALAGFRFLVYSHFVAYAALISPGRLIPPRFYLPLPRSVPVFKT